MLIAQPRNQDISRICQHQGEKDAAHERFASSGGNWGRLMPSLRVMVFCLHTECTLIQIHQNARSLRNWSKWQRRRLLRGGGGNLTPSHCLSQKVAASINNTDNFLQLLWEEIAGLKKEPHRFREAKLSVSSNSVNSSKLLRPHAKQITAAIYRNELQLKRGGKRIKEKWKRSAASNEDHQTSWDKERKFMSGSMCWSLKLKPSRGAENELPDVQRQELALPADHASAKSIKQKSATVLANATCDLIQAEVVGDLEQLEEIIWRQWRRRPWQRRLWNVRWAGREGENEEDVCKVLASNSEGGC